MVDFGASSTIPTLLSYNSFTWWLPRPIFLGGNRKLGT